MYSIVALILHGTAGTDSRAYLQRGGDRPDGSDRGVSIHYLIRQNGVIEKMLDETRAANHAGAASARLTVAGKTYTGAAINAATIGIELESLQRGNAQDYTPVQLASLGWLIADIRNRRGMLPIVRHGDIDPTRRRDPVGLSVEKMEDLYRAAIVPTMPPAIDLNETRRFRAGRYGAVITQDYRASSTPVAYIAPGNDIILRRFLPDGAWERNEYFCVASGAGFVPKGCVE